MELPEFELIQPHSLQEACSILGEHDRKAVLLAGGTALMVALRYRLSKPAVVIGLKGLTALDYVSRNGSGGLAIGSMVTLETLEKSPLVLNEYAPLAQAVQLVAIPSIRDKATIGGNLCLDTRCIYYNQSEFWRSGQKACFKLGGDICHAVEKGRRCQAVYQGDLGPVLIALGAEVKIASAKGEKTIPLAEFFTGRGEKPNVLKPDEILVEVRIPTLWARGCLGLRETPCARRHGFSYGRSSRYGEEEPEWHHRTGQNGTGSGGVFPDRGAQGRGTSGGPQAYRRSTSACVPRSGG